MSRRALLARPNDLVVETMRRIVERAGCLASVAANDDDLEQKLHEPFELIVVSDSASSVVTRPWREVLALAAKEHPSARLVLVHHGLATEAMRRLRPDFELVFRDEAPTSEARAVLGINVETLGERDGASWMSELLCKLLG